MKKYILAILALSFIWYCQKKNYALEFIKNHEKEDFSRLKNVIIEARNNNDGRFQFNNFYYFINQDTFFLPSYQYFTNNEILNVNDSLFQVNIQELMKKKNISYDEVEKLIKGIDDYYHRLNVININSNPNRGEFIEFLIKPNCKVYYIFDEKNIGGFWKNKFNTLNKFNKEWLYTCK